MPFFKEISVFRPTPVVNRETYIPTGQVSLRTNAVDFDQWSRMTTWRTGAPKGNLVNTPVDELSFDKYAYFLNSTRDRKFEDALRLRGMDLAPMPPDRGHPFSLEKVYRNWRGNGRVSRAGYYHWDVIGFMPMRTTSSLADESMPISDIDTFAYQSWGRTAPASEVFNAGQFFGELREGLPSIVPSLLKGKLSFFKDLGSDYLNVEFGWKPFLSDLQNAAKALNSAQTSISQPYGPVHRYRKIEYPQTVDDKASSFMNLQLGGSPFQNDAPASLVRKIHPEFIQGGGPENLYGREQVIVERKNWFEANFFRLPKIGFDPSSYLSRLDSLVDSRITPAVLWELSPWSWLVDWGLHIGDALQTADALADDRVHAQYAYGMSTSKVTRTYYLPQMSASQTYIRKERVRANPYGFKVGGYAGLNTWQQSILLALGLTKTR